MPLNFRHHPEAVVGVLGPAVRRAIKPTPQQSFTPPISSSRAGSSPEKPTGQGSCNLADRNLYLLPLAHRLTLKQKPRQSLLSSCLSWLLLTSRCFARRSHSAFFVALTGFAAKKAFMLPPAGFPSSRGSRLKPYL